MSARSLIHNVMLLLLIGLLFAANLTAAGPEQPAAAPLQAETGVPLQVLNRTVTVFRGTFMGVSPLERAERAEHIIERLLKKGGGKGEVSLKSSGESNVIMLDGVMVFIMVPDDVDPASQEKLADISRSAVAALSRIVFESRESRNIASLLQGLLQAALASGLLLALIWCFSHARAWIADRLTRVAGVFSGKFTVAGESILHSELIVNIIGRFIRLAYWLINVLLIFNWLGYVLSRFPYTRPWGEQLSQYLLDGAAKAGSGALQTIPDLVIALLIFYGAYLVIGFLGSIFNRIEQQKFSLAGLDSDTVRPTRRLVSLAVWLFALVMAYPYLPGAHTEAFKGLTVLVGLMISLGGSSVVGQAASGLILMYTGTLRPGEYVQIGDCEGTVMELSMFNTRIRTGMGEEISMPNALILSQITRNHSRAVSGPGYLVNVTVTIGYDTPWRQVHAMLIEAAHRTGGILANPPAKVFQTALSDFYPQYRLVCHATAVEAHSRAEVMGTLHANIQDVFNEYGVQIMSPHYFHDPDQPKVVPPDKWAPPPAG